MARAATVAARSSRCTSAAVSGAVGEKAPSRPWSEDAGDDLDEGARCLAAAAGAVAGRPARSRRAGGRCGRSSRGPGRARPRPSPPAMARTRPSVVVTTAAPPKKPATASHSSAGRRRRARSARARGAPRPRARAARPGARRTCSRALAAGGAGRSGSRVGDPRSRVAADVKVCASPRPIVGNNDHLVTVDPSLASPYAAPQDRAREHVATRALPAAVSTLVGRAGRRASRSPATVLGAHAARRSTCDVAGRVLPVVTSDAVAARRPPLRLAVPSGAAVDLGCRRGRRGRGRWPAAWCCRAATSWRVRTWRPARVRCVVRPRVGCASGRRAADLQRLELERRGGPPTRVARGRHPRRPPVGAPVVAGQPPQHARDSAVAGCRARAGLTPSGDDALAGALLVAHAVGAAARSRTPCAPGSARPPRSRPPCSTPPPTGTPRPTSSPSSTPRSPATDAAVARALPAVLAIGHTSGADLVAGIAGSRCTSCSRRPDAIDHHDRTERRMTTHVELRRRGLPRLGEPDAGLAGRRRHPRRPRRPGRDGHRAQRRRPARAWASTCPPRPGPTTSSSPCAPTTPDAAGAGLAAVADALAGAARHERLRAVVDEAVAPRTLGSAAARARRHAGRDLGARPARRDRGLRRHRVGPVGDAVLRQRLRRGRGARSRTPRPRPTCSSWAPTAARRTSAGSPSASPTSCARARSASSRPRAPAPSR